MRGWGWLLRDEAAAGKYTYEYVFTVPNQPTRHMTTIFTLASDNIVTFRTQTKEADFTKVKASLQDILGTFAIKKLA